MKKLFLFIIIGTMLLLTGRVMSQTYLPLEGFEGGSRPAGWIEIKSDGSAPDWRYQNGGYTKSVVGHPPSAYAGTKNALFQAETVGPYTKLVTPSMNLTGAKKPTLNFWHAQEQWASATDILKIYYRVSTLSSWVLIQTYTQPTGGWVEREILLPDAAKVATCQVAFEGTTQWGWGVCLDNVQIIDRAIIPRFVDGIGFKQKTSQLPSGSKVNPLGYIAVTIGGNDGTIPANSFIIHYTGDNISDVNQYSLYYTTDSVFTVTSKINASVTPNGSDITITPSTPYNLVTGVNYFWICANISSSAQHGHTVDYTIAPNSISIGSNLYPSTTQTPSGWSTVEESLFYDDFETLKGWTLNGDWQIGIPMGTGTYDPNYAYEGTKVLATNLNGNYSSDISPLSPHKAIATSVNAKYYQNLNIRFNRFLNVDFFDKARVKVSNDGGTNWSTVMENNNTINDGQWRPISHSISSQATRKDDVKVQFAMDETNSYTEYGGWNVDNFAITGDYIASDVGIKSMVAPLPVCGLGNSETVKVLVKNYGAQTVSTDFMVGYSLDNGATYTEELFTPDINSEQEIEFTFSTHADFSVAGLKNLMFKTFLTGDEDTKNDAISKLFYVFPKISTFPYTASFESTADNWYASGTNSTWAWGVPAKGTINTASDGTKAWVTSLSTNYKNNELSYLESPCFDLHSSQYPVLAFDYLLQTEEGIDGFAIEYSKDGGLNWLPLTAHANYAANWYNTTTVTALGKAGWSVNKTTYTTAKTLLPDDAKVDGFKIRIVFASNGTNVNEGVAVDKVRIYELPYNLGITALNSPTDACEIGAAVPVNLTIKNIGYRPIPVGTVIPIGIKVDQNTIVNESYTTTGILVQNATVNYPSTNNYNFFAAGTHTVKASTNLAIDDDRTNDTLKTSNQVLVKGMPGFTLGPDIGTTTPGSITLDAGAGYTYVWQKKIDTGSWTSAGTTRTHTVISDLPIVDSAVYSVQITNGVPCVASDIIKIIISDKNVGVSAISNLSTACTHSTPIHPQVTVKNFNSSTFSGTEVIPLAIMVNGVEVLTENSTPTAGWGGVDATYNYTFTGSIDLSQAKSYSVRIYSKLGKDLDKSNDTTKLSVTTWGAPSVNLGVRTGNGKSISRDTISTANADTLRFGVPNIYTPPYLWERKRDGESSWSTLSVTIDSLKLHDLTYSNNSAQYRITATDSHGCGTATDKIYVNAKDLGVLAIISPSSSVCYNPKGIPFTMDIKNFGQDDYPAGTPIAATCITPVGVQNVNINLSQNLTSGNKITVQFPELVKLPVGDNFVRFSTAIDGDPNPSNDFKEMLINVKLAPEVNIPIDTLFRTFAPTDSYTISPIYSTDCKTYLWQDNTTVDSIYTFTDAPLFNKYIVVATNDLGCSGSDSLVIVTRDISVSEIKTPENKCQLASGASVTFTLTNSGNTDIPAGTKVNVNLNLNGVNKGTEQITLGAFAAGASVDETLATTLDLTGMTNATIQVSATLVGLRDVDSDNNAKNKSVYSTGNPVISLGGPTKTVHAWQEVLQPGNQFKTYLWQDNSTNSTFTATTNGTYSVTVTDFYNCSGSASVVLTFLVDDISLVSVDSPVTGCGLTSAETVAITIKNNGTWTIPSGTTIQLKYKVDGGTTVSQPYTFTSSFAPNATLSINLTNKVNLSVRKTYSILAWVELANDMVTANDSQTVSVTAKADVTVDLGPDIVHPGSATLDAGPGYASYLWSTGATTQTIVVTGTGDYSVQVSNAQGCTANDNIHVTYQVPDIQAKEINASLNDCNNTSSETVGLTIKNVGEWTFNTGNTINMRIKNNGTQIADELLTLTDPFAPNETIYYEYTTKVDLSAVGDYKLEVFFNNSLDKNQTNDTLKTTVSTFTVSLGTDQTICEGFSTTLDAGNPGATYSWSDGTNTIGTNQTLTVGTAGIYTVTVTKNGCSISDAITITVTPAPIVNLGPNRVICNGAPQTLDAGNAGATYSWSDGTSILGTNQTLVVSTSGNYRATVTKSGCTAYDEVLVSFETNPTINLGGNQNLCTGSSLELDGGEAYTGWTWNTGATTRKITVTTAGTYSVTATNSTGCVGTGSATITIVPLPVVNLGPDKAICAGQNTTLDAGNPSSTYLWSTTATTQTIQVSTAGTYTVQVTNSNGCVNTDAITITVNPLPTVTYTGPTSTCKSTPLTLSGGNPAGGSYSGSGVSGTTFTPTGDGPYPVSYQYTNGNGCSNTATFSITINPLPVVNLGADQTITSPLTLDALNPGSTYSWSDGTSVIGTGQTLVVSATGTYTVTVTTINGCIGSDAINITWKNVSDVQITALSSPSTNCYNSLGQTVTAELTNVGTRTFNPGDQIDVIYKVGTSTPVAETMTFTSSFAPGSKINYTFNQKALINVGSTTMVLKTKISGVDGVESTPYAVVINTKPALDLGRDTVSTALPYTIVSGISNVTYLWSTGSTNASITVSTYGKYILTVTNGVCTAKDSVVIRSISAVETISGTNAKVYLFPNPVSDELSITIETDKNDEFSIDLINPNGQIVKNLKTEKTLYFSNKISVEGFTPGIYFVKVSNSKGFAVFKVIVQR